MAGLADEPSGDTVPTGTTSKGLLVGKKKATGMSKRLGFTDRATINENKDILRFNERLEREARGLPPEEPRRGPRRDGSRGPGARPHGDRPQGERPGRTGAARPPRAARPPALDDEQTAALTAAYRGVVGESGLEAAAEQVIARLAAHDTFERASLAGWEVASGGHADERTTEQWELLRQAWLGIRLALLEAYAAFTPAAAEALSRERKQQARLAKPARPRRRPGRRPAARRASHQTPPGDERPAAPAGPRPPSPADVARHVAAHGATTPDPAGTGAVPTETTPAVPTLADAVAATPALPVPRPPAPALTSSFPPGDPDTTDGADPERDVALPDAPADREGEHDTAREEPPAEEPGLHEPGPDDRADGDPVAPDEATSGSVPADHEAYGAPAPGEDASDRPDENQLALEI